MTSRLLSIVVAVACLAAACAEQPTATGLAESTTDETDSGDTDSSGETGSDEIDSSGDSDSSGATDSGGASGVVIEHTFDESPEGWQIIGDSSDAYLAGGAAVGEDATAGDTWWFAAPPAVIEEVAIDRTVTFDLRVDRIPTSPFEEADFVVTAGSEAIYALFDQPTNEWTTYSLDLDDVDWWVAVFDGTNLTTSVDDGAATPAQVERMLRSADGVWIRGEYNRGSDMGFLDNFVITAD